MTASPMLPEIAGPSRPSVPAVPGVRGELPADDLGVTLVHPALLPRPGAPASFATAVARLRELRAQGVRTVVDPVPGRSAQELDLLARLGERVPEVHVVVASGPPDPGEPGSGPSTKLLVRDVRTGLDGGGVRAALLACAIGSDGLLIEVERALRAVGRAHVVTGSPILVRTDPVLTTGLDVAHVLEEEGVRPDAVLLTQCGDTGDADHLTELAACGYLLGMDRTGPAGAPPGERLDVLAALCRRGYADRVMLPLDASCPQQPLAATVRGLRERGLGEAEVQAMLVDTPRRWLTGADRRLAVA